MTTFAEPTAVERAEANEQKKIEHLREMKGFLEHIEQKQSSMERRQCDEGAVGTDAIRMTEAFRTRRACQPDRGEYRVDPQDHHFEQGCQGNEA